MIIERREQVTASRTGFDGRLTPIAVLDMFQDCDSIGVESDAGLDRYMRERGVAVFLVSRQTKFLTLPMYRDCVTVRTFPYENNIHFGYRYTELIGVSGELFAYCHAIAVYADLATGKAVRLPRDVADSVQLFEPPRLPLLDRRIRVENAPIMSIATLSIFNRDIDMNRHLNNVRCVEKALQLLPQDFTFGSHRVEYKNAAKLGDTLYAELRGSTDTRYVTFLDAPGGKIFAVMEFAP